MIQIDSNIDEVMGWLKRAKEGVGRACREATTSDRAVAIMYEDALRDLYDVIYEQHKNNKVYERTYAILNALVVVPVGQDPPAASIAIELAEEVRAKLQPRTVSYARFFLPQHAADTFLRHRPGNIPTRDFLTRWVLSFSGLVPQMVGEALDKELRKP